MNASETRKSLPVVKRVLTVIVAVLPLVGAIAAIGIGWFYASEIKTQALDVNHTRANLDLVVVAVDDSSIRLAATDATDLENGDWRSSGLWGLEWNGGHARVGKIIKLLDNAVVREFSAIVGHVSAGDRVRLEGWVFRGDPLTALGLPFEWITFESELGQLGGWRVEGSSDTWAVFTHGKGSNGAAALRFLTPFADAEIPSLIIEYRNDDGVAGSASGYYEYGQSEWRDLEAAVRYALAQGALDVVLFGSSMGGAITVSFLYKSDLAEHVRGVILDSPILDFGDVIDYGGERRRLPRIFTWLGKTVASLRFGFGWRDRDYLSRSDLLNVPILLFHGDADRLVHVRTSDALAEERPDIVTYVRVNEATHSRAWNVDPETYEHALVEFLDVVLH